MAQAAQSDQNVYEINALGALDGEALPVYWARTPSSGLTPAPHVCSKNGMAYHLRIVNNSDSRIAVKIRVDGQSALPPGACFIVRGNKLRDLPGFQQKREFHEGSFKHTYADFVFGRPDLNEEAHQRGGATGLATAAAAANDDGPEIGVIEMDVYHAVEMACPAQTISGATAARQSVSAEKKEAVFSSLTVAGASRSQPAKKIASWYKEGGDILQTVKLHYKEIHALVFFGVDRTLLGLSSQAAARLPQPRAQPAPAAAAANSEFIEECEQE